MPTKTLKVPAGVEINGGKVRELRKQRGVNLTEFATHCGISFGYLSQIERGYTSTVSPRIFIQLCDAFDFAESERSQILTRAARLRVRDAA